MATWTKEHYNKATKKYQHKLRLAGLCLGCREPNTDNKSFCPNCRNIKRTYYRTRKQNIRALILENYGGQCSHCGESRPQVLDLDHVNNDGNSHRKRQRGGSAGIYPGVIKAGYPSTYQLLCRNCNWLKYRLGGKLPEPEPIPIGVCNAYCN